MQELPRVSHFVTVREHEYFLKTKRKHAPVPDVQVLQPDSRDPSFNLLTLDGDDPLAWWLAHTDYYSFPHVQQFASVAELLAVLPSSRNPDESSMVERERR